MRRRPPNSLNRSTGASVAAGTFDSDEQERFLDLLFSIVSATDSAMAVSSAVEGLSEGFPLTWAAVAISEGAGPVVSAVGGAPPVHVISGDAIQDESLAAAVYEALGVASGSDTILVESTDGAELAATLLVAPVMTGHRQQTVLIAELATETVDLGTIRKLIESVARFLAARLSATELRYSERHHLDELIKLQNITVRIIRDPRRATSSEDVLVEIARAFDFAGIRLGVIDANRVDFYDRFRDAVTGQHVVSSVPRGAGVAGRALRTGEPQLVENLAADPDYINDRDDINQELCVPIRDESGEIGVLLMQAAEPRRIAVEDLGTALMLAETIGLALTNHRRLEALRRRNQQLQLVDSVVALIAGKASISEDLHEVLDDLAHRFDYSLVTFGWVRGDYIDFEVVSYDGNVPIDLEVPLSRGVVGRVASTGKPAFVQDTLDDPDYVDAGIGSISEICYPVHSNGEVIAVINVESTENRRLVEADFEIIGIISKHLGIAFENEALLRSEREARRAVQAVERISAIVSGTLDLVQAFRLAVETLHEAFDYEVVVVGTIDGQLIVPRAVAGVDEEHLAPVPVGQGIIGYVVEHGEAVHVTTWEGGPDFLPANLKWSSQIVVPILSGGVVSGVLEVTGSEDRPLEERDLELLNLFADHAGVAINNARHYEEIRRLATTDAVTEVPNHRSFQEKFVEAFDEAVEREERITIMIIDLDEFKQVNDRFGHVEGDRVLRRVAKALNAVLRDDDFFARYAGDEFVAILQGVSMEQAQAIGERLVSQVRALSLQSPDGDKIVLSVSIGFATFPDQVESRVALLQTADKAMFEAKSSGKNRVAGYEQIADGG